MRHPSIRFTSIAMVFGILTLGHASDWSLSGNLALTSDYVFRGFSQTDSSPALQVGADASHAKGFFVGAWGSNIDKDFFANAPVEIDLYLGWSKKLGATGPDFTVKALRMNYPGTDYTENNTNEFSVYLGQQFGKILLSGGANYSNDSYGSGKAFYWDAGMNAPVGSATLDLHVGLSDFDYAGDYLDFSLSMSRDLFGLNLSLAYIGMKNADNCYKDFCDDRVVFTISKLFMR